MLSDDVYRAGLAASFAALKRAVEPWADVAMIDTAETADFARLSLIPHANGACPVEIMLRRDQFYDIALGSEFYEDCPVDTFDLFLPLIMAVTRGDVIQRRHLSAATGSERAIATIVTLPDGALWQRGHAHPAIANAIPDEATVFNDRSFLPYRR